MIFILTNEERIFHSSRIAFAIINDTILFLHNNELGHYQWLVDSGMILECEFNIITRGFIKNNNIYFYKGDFKTDLSLEKEALLYTTRICNELNIHTPSHIYCGFHKGNIGEFWKPIKSIEIPHNTNIPFKV